MKVLLLNGSSHKTGTTAAALDEMARVFQENNIETEVFHIGADPIRDCIACGYCNSHDGCVFKDDRVNEFVEKAKSADGFVFGSPVYYAHPTGRILSFLDRAFCSNGENEIYDAFQYKPGASVVCARRGGTTASLDVLNKYFGIAQMPQAGSTYWNMVHGACAADTQYDEEGLQTMRNLANNMIWLMQSSKIARENGFQYPVAETAASTNFVRKQESLS